ncbi:unnamed protein product [Phytophthora lilii]|uniref:Unnamed protein product n=1 Tax=Phytophthora lilii TaxID=2077276 RepID=A0A9W7CNE5_9STRA|nr:unnamed protein product [Phytophthora lilii]
MVSRFVTGERIEFELDEVVGASVVDVDGAVVNKLVMGERVDETKLDVDGASVVVLVDGDDGEDADVSEASEGTTIAPFVSEPRLSPVSRPSRRFRRACCSPVSTRIACVCEASVMASAASARPRTARTLTMAVFLATCQSIKVYVGASVERGSNQEGPIDGMAGPRAGDAHSRADRLQGHEGREESPGDGRSRDAMGPGLAASCRVLAARN